MAGIRQRQQQEQGTVNYSSRISSRTKISYRRKNRHRLKSLRLAKYGNAMLHYYCDVCHYFTGMGMGMEALALRVLGPSPKLELLDENALRGARVESARPQPQTATH